MNVFGVPVPGPLTLVGAAAGTVRGAVSLAERPRRHVWSSPTRHYIEVHGVHGPEGETVARRVEHAVEAYPGVRWARVNAPSSRVVVTLSDPQAARRPLVEAVRRAERTPTEPEELAAEDEVLHPAAGLRGTRLLPTLAVDLLALSTSLLTRLAPWAPLPPELAALIGTLDHHPDLRESVARRAHSHSRGESLTSMVGALAQGLAAGGEGVVLDMAQRAGQWREARALGHAWNAVEERLVTGPEAVGVAAEPVERPAPPPEGPTDRYQRRAFAAGAVAAAATVPFTGLRRATAVGLAAVPKPVETARSAFGSALGLLLARRGAVVMDRTVLRHVDRIDAVVLDRAALETGRLALTDLVALPGADSAEVAETAWRLFDPARPDRVQHGAPDGEGRNGPEREWWLAPLDPSHTPADDAVPTGADAPATEQTAATGEGVESTETQVVGRAVRTLRRRGASRVLGLRRGDRLHAVLGLRAEALPGAHLLTVAANRVRVPVSETDDPHALVRDLQRRGHGVLLVSGDRRALALADCAVGIHADDEHAPWGAHVLVGTDVATAALLIESVGAVRTVTAQSLRIAQASSGVGMATALRCGAATNPTSAAMRAVNAGSAVALVNARRHVFGLREPAPVDLADAVPWHLMPPAVVLERFRTSAGGLPEAEAEARRRASGRGRPAVRATGLAGAFLSELANPLTPVLAGGAALSATVGSPVDAALVGGVVAVSALLGSVQRVHTERELAELLSRTSVSATVVRDGQERVSTADDLVPGDVVALTAGDVVPADCRLLEATGLETDESSLTGESLPVAKDPAPVVSAEVARRASMVFEGTTVAAGQATAVVVAVGDDTQAGRSMAVARDQAPTTGVESRLTELTERSLPLAVSSAAAVAGAGLLRGVPLRESLGAAVNLAVASVPEGLPFLVGAAQLAAARRLATHGALVRNPRSIEALGRTDVLCFDKTGTLTEGWLTVSEVDDGHTRARVDALTEPLRPVLAAALRATPHADAVSDLPHATDRAIAEAGIRTTMTAATGASGWREITALPFESSRGFHAAIGVTRRATLVCVKGAPEAVLPRCELDARTRRRLAARIRTLAGAGHRVLAVAERTLPPGAEQDVDDAGEWGAALVHGLTFRGFLALADPVRSSAAPAAARLRAAGVHIVMLTGDHPATGEAIASEINGHDAGLHVVTGPEIDELDDDALRARLPDVDVIARCTPAHKVRIVEAYRALGRTVAMTGDGANDAPAIRLADVGIALGGRGTPAARASADLVVTDDRLETIIAALVEGRAMWVSVRAALGVLLGGNLGEVAFTVLGAALAGRSPLNARQLLLVNLLTDLAPSLAIALRRPDVHVEGELLREGPESSLGAPLYREIGVRAGTTTLSGTVAWTLARLTGRRRRAGTVALAALVGTQLGQTLLSGGRSPSVLLSGLGSAAVLAAVVQTPGVSRFFGCTPLGPVGWTIALGSATATTALGAVVGGPRAATRQ